MAPAIERSRNVLLLVVVIWAIQGPVHSFAAPPETEQAKPGVLVELTTWVSTKSDQFKTVATAGLATIRDIVKPIWPAVTSGQETAPIKTDPATSVATAALMKAASPQTTQPKSVASAAPKAQAATQIVQPKPVIPNLPGRASPQLTQPKPITPAAPTHPTPMAAAPTQIVAALPAVPGSAQPTSRTTMAMQTAAPAKTEPLKPVAPPAPMIIHGIAKPTTRVTIPSQGGIRSQHEQPKPVGAVELTTIRGIVKPRSRATIASQIDARITSLPFRDGQRFKKGSQLVAMDCVKHRAELAGASAEQTARKKILETNLKLLKLRAIGASEVDVSRAEAEKAAAAVQVARVQVQGCSINAPFSGRVVSVKVNEHERVFPNDQLLTILDDSRLEIELILPSHALSWLKAGTSFEFMVDETKQAYKAHITRIGASVDPVSQTVQIVGEFSAKPKDVLAGMSGTAAFSEKQP